MKVEALNCPNCGAGVESDRQMCQFCKTRLKTVACSQCLGLMFVGSRFCGRCGAIAAPVEVLLEEKGGDCPRCRFNLEKLVISDASFSICSKCDGVWLGIDPFENICADREQQSAVMSHFQTRTFMADLPTKVTYVPCPTCGELMNRSNFSRVSGVIVDICKKHGVWFDADELPAIIEFVRNGGLEIARRREKAELDDERSRLRAMQWDQTKRTRQTDDESGGIREFVQGLFD